MPEEKKQWFAMRAYKKEKHAEEAIAAFAPLECFVAKQFVLRTYHGKKHRVVVPLIPSLVFVYGKKSDIQRFKAVHTYLQYISTGGHVEAKGPLVVPEKQMLDFITVAQQYESDIHYYTPGEVALVKGSKVKILGGVFEGVVGTLLEDKQAGDKKVLVSLPGNLGSISTTSIESELLEVVEDE